MSPNEFKNALALLGWKQSDFCDKAGVSRDSPSRWANGRTAIPDWVPAFMGAMTEIRRLHQTYVEIAPRVEKLPLIRNRAELDQFIEDVAERHEAIGDIWLIGSQANGTATTHSDWDLLAFADEATWTQLTHEPLPANVDFLVVVDGDHFFEPARGSRGAKHGTLSGWRWRKTSERDAEYFGSKNTSEDEYGSSGPNSKGLRIWIRAATLETKGNPYDDSPSPNEPRA